MSSKYMVPWTRTKSHPEDSAFSSDTLGALIEEWTQVQEIYLSWSKQAPIENSSSKQVFKSRDGGQCRSKDLQSTRNCRSYNFDDKRDDAVAFFRNLSPFYFLLGLHLKSRHALVFIYRLWRFLKDPRSQLVIRLKHLTNSLAEFLTYM